MSTAAANNEAEILSRIIDPGKSGIPAHTAGTILALDFPGDDRDRMNQLAERARAGSLTPEEQLEIDAYERVGHFLSLLQSKARISLKKANHKPEQRVERSLVDQAWRRANGICEHCLLPQEFDHLPLQIDHIIARKHHSSDDADNLAPARFACNNHKGPNIAGVDSMTGDVIRLFHPRHDKWADHFEWRGASLVGRTPIGRATVAVLEFNLPHRIRLREMRIEEGVFPSRRTD